MNEVDSLNDAARWDFEKYESVILYLHAYCEKRMTPEERRLMDTSEDNDFQIPVSIELLQELDFEESFDEFCNEVQVMHEDMTIVDGDSSMITMERVGDKAVLTVDLFIMKMMATLMDGDDDIDFEEFFSDLSE